MSKDRESNDLENGDRHIEPVEFDAPGSSSTANSKPTSPVGNEHQADSNSPISSATAAYTAARKATQRKWWHSQFNLMLAAFALLAFTAVVFVLLYPTPSSEQRVAEIPQRESQRLPDAAAPWSQSQLAEARADSQEILSNLLDSKKSLEEKGVLEWAPERYQEALDLAAEGDEFYKDQNFKDAIQSYQQAADQMAALFEFLPALIEKKIAEGNKALSEGKSALATQLFSQAVALEPSNLAATSGLSRAGKLDQVLALISEAKLKRGDYQESQELDDLLSAENKLLEAEKVDGEYQPVQVALERVQQEIIDKRFKIQMSKAYQALFANRYASARAAFSQALKIKPDSKEAATALQQSLASDKSASLQTLLTQANRFEKNEEWASAESNYETVLQRDPNQVSAKLGKIRSSARRQLDAQLSDVLTDTLAFSRNERRAKAESALKEALAVRTKGPRLQQQIETLQSALNQAEALIQLMLSSDNLTEVSLLKKGARPIKLGKFSRKTLTLKPGRYAAVGVRLGYQDIRQEIELLPSAEQPVVVEVKCEDAIGANQSLEFRSQTIALTSGGRVAADGE